MSLSEYCYFSLHISVRAGQEQSQDGMFVLFTLRALDITLLWLVKKRSMTSSEFV